MVGRGGVSRWCLRHLGSAVSEVYWVRGHLSTAVALELLDGREVVVKIRPENPRLDACHEVHRVVWSAGFPCPEPLTSPIPLGDQVASAEVFMPGGRAGRHDDPWLAAATASELRRLILLAPRNAEVGSVAPPPAWAGWSDPHADPWPVPDEGQPLNDDPATEGLRPLVRALNEVLCSTRLPSVVGHCDWYQGNLRWEAGTLFAADDWDSIAVLPEAAFAGCSAVSYLPAPDGEDPDRPGAGIEETESFLELYATARGRSFSEEEIRVAWAAGLWQRVYDAAKYLVAGRPEKAADQLRDAGERRRRAGF